MMFALALAVAGFADESIFASSIKTTDLAPICADTASDPLAMNLCTGYILGTLDALVTRNQICPVSAKGLTVRALQIGREALASDPARNDRPPAKIIGDALRKAYPCGTPA